ncbi:MAG TPA: hypothetical protein VE733_29725, partial [Streptosporangiaceae bacterium]|nr:hypothetical protein [Streptosporangiaceae bacterium]
ASPAMSPGGPSIPVSFTVAINGQAVSPPLFSFAVTPGRTLKINVEVTVPAHATVTALWLGIDEREWGLGPAGPIGMRPVLAHTRKPLTTGSHAFRLQWTVPTSRFSCWKRTVPAGQGCVALVAAWWGRDMDPAWWARGQDQGVAQPIAVLFTPASPNGSG